VKKIIMCMLIIFLSGCAACIKKPDPYISKKTGSPRCPYICYKAELCEYYNTVRKDGQIDCSALHEKCEKLSTYKNCCDPDFRYKGVKSNNGTYIDQPHTWQQCWDKLR